MIIPAGFDTIQQQGIFSTNTHERFIMDLKRRTLEYVPLAAIARAVNNIVGDISLDGSDIFAYLTEVANITYDADQQGVLTNLGFVIEELAGLTAEDLDSHYCYGVENDPESMQGIVGAIAKLHQDICKTDGAKHESFWDTVVITESGD